MFTLVYIVLFFGSWISNYLPCVLESGKKLGPIYTFKDPFKCFSSDLFLVLSIHQKKKLSSNKIYSVSSETEAHKSQDKD